jgi:hypothetical protein
LPFIKRIFADAGYHGPKAARLVAARRLDARDRQAHRRATLGRLAKP